MDEIESRLGVINMNAQHCESNTFSEERVQSNLKASQVPQPTLSSQLENLTKVDGATYLVEGPLHHCNTQYM